MSRPLIRRRSARAATSIVVAILLLGIAVGGLWLGGHLLLAGPDGAQIPAEELRWNSSGVLASAGALLLAGILLLAAARPGPPLVREIRSAPILRPATDGVAEGMDDGRGADAPEERSSSSQGPILDVRRVRTYVSTRGLANIAAGEASRSGGISSERVRRRRGALQVRAVTTGDDADADRRVVHARIMRRLGELPLQRPGRVRVRLHRGGRS
ncbi:hypothetical protein GCM10027060_11070 [Nesterenkonia halophila]